MVPLKAVAIRRRVRGGQMMRSGLWIRWSATLGLMLLAGLASFGQSTSGSITGTVMDSTGAAIADASVTITNRETNSTRTVNSNTVGIFVAPQLPPGRYDITVEKSGFKKLLKTDVILNAIEQINAGHFTLDIGAVTESVSVTAEVERTEIQSESGERSGLVTGTQLRDLALNGRNYHDFLKTLPGVITGNVSTGQVSSSTGSLGSFNVNGTRSNQKELTVDGSSDIDTGNNVDTHASVNPDAIAEFQVLTSNFQAEYGGAGGALGSAGPVHLLRSIFGRLGGFNENKDKLFFYWNQEWYQQLAPEGTRNIRVPSLAERNGDFSKTTDGNGNPVIVRSPFTRQPYTGNIIPSTEPWFANGQAILKLYPQPNVEGNPQFNYTSAVSTQYPRREDILRIDYNITERTHLMVRYTNNHEKRLLAYGSFASDLNFPLSPISFPRPGRNGVLTLTHTFSPTLTNEFIFGPSSNFIDLRPSNDLALASANGITVPKLFPSVGFGYVPNFRYGGIDNQTFPFTNFNGLPFINQNHTFNFIDNVVKIIGSHMLKAGFYAQRSRKDQKTFGRPDTEINFNNDTNNSLNTGHPYANALLGIYNNYTQASNFLKGFYRYWNIEGYVQDNWKATRKLTLDYGLRISWYEPQYDVRLQTGAFNPSVYDPSKTPRLYLPVCLNNSAPCSGGARRRAVDPAKLVPGFVPTELNTLPSNFIAALVSGTGDIANGIGQASKGYPRGGYDSRGPQWGPRLGLAYHLLGNGKTVGRGGLRSHSRRV